MFYIRQPRFSRLVHQCNERVTSSDITYLYNLYLNRNAICVCKMCLYYWTWTSVYTKAECRHCVNNIPKGTYLNIDTKCFKKI